jgi:hypothetical protein
MAKVLSPTVGAKTELPKLGEEEEAKLNASEE